MPTPRWYDLRYHADHAQIMASDARFILMRAGRRSGKTEIGKRKLVMQLPIKKPWHDPKYFFAAPTRQQAKEIAWEDLKALVPKNWLRGRPSETELKINTVFGSSLQVVGLDQPQRIEGKGYDAGYIDEMSDTKPQALSVSIFPAMADRHGSLMMGGVPKRAGVGAVFFNRLFDMARDAGVMEGTNDRMEAYSWESATVLSEEELAFFRGIMDPQDFDEQFRAMIQTMGGQVFHSFGEHNIETVKYDPYRPIIVGMDFNVDPMCWVLCHEIDGQLCQFDELWKRNTWTTASLDHLASRYAHHENGWQFYGDASSRSRNTRASASDYVHVMNDARFKNKQLRFPKSNPLILNRISACNAVFLAANGNVRYQVDPSCTKTIEDLQLRAFKEGTTQLDDGPMIGHITDALGYIVHARYPMSVKRPGKVGIGLH